MSNIDVLKGLEFVSTVNLDPTKPEHNIAEMSEISKNSSSFEKRFLDGSPFFTWVEFSITDLCNRTCVFCPRFDPMVYPNNNAEISLKLYEKTDHDAQWNGWRRQSRFIVDELQGIKGLRVCLEDGDPNRQGPQAVIYFEICDFKRISDFK